MFDEHQDKAAAEEAFLSIFADVSEEEKRKLINIFLREFIKNYKSTKALLQNDRTILSVIPDSVYQANRLVLRCNSTVNRYKETEYLGAALGLFLAVSEYGFTNSIFGNYIIDKGRDRRLEIFILNETESIVSMLKRLSKSVKPKFIRHRLEKIIGKSTLNDSQKSFINKIATMFT